MQRLADEQQLASLSAALIQGRAWRVSDVSITGNYGKTHITSILLESPDTGEIVALRATRDQNGPRIFVESVGA